jgi:hypothetical protein
MRDEDFEKLTELTTFFDQSFGQPAIPERAIQRVVTAAASLAPLQHFLTQQLRGDLDPNVQDWLTPMVIDAVQVATAAIGELYDALESEIDDVQLMEPGTMGNQGFRDLPIGDPRLGRGGGDLVR